MSNYTIIKKHKSDIIAGDTIMHNGKMMTVCKKDITRCPFLGTKIFGDSYSSGRKPVEFVQFIKAKIN